MSYCRWSSDDWACDVYVYEANEGYVTNVASARHVHPEGTPCPTIDIDNFAVTYEAQQFWLNEAELVPIDLPMDGQNFLKDTPGECAAALVELREMGYNVPQYAVDALNQEEQE